MISPDRAHAYVHHYNNSIELALPHDPIRAQVFAICADMCNMARVSASVGAGRAEIHMHARHSRSTPNWDRRRTGV